MVNIGATHNFIGVGETKRLGLKVAKKSGSLKVVNLEACSIHGVTHEVEMRIVAWKSTMDLSVVLIDDFQVVLGMDFYNNLEVILVPFVNLVYILKKSMPCMISVIQGTKFSSKMLSAL